MAVTPVDAPVVPSVVLVLRALGLGDTLTGIPALRGLRRAYPDARLLLAAPPGVADWLVEQDVVDATVPVQGLEPVPWEGPAPDVAVNLHGRGPQSHRLLQNLSPKQLIAFACREADFGVDHAAGATGAPTWDPEEHEVDRWCRLVHSVGGACGPDDLRLTPPTSAATDASRPVARRDYVVVHPGAASGSRRWPVQRWRAVTAALAAAGHQVLVTGTEAERELCAAVAGGSPGVADHCGRHHLNGLAGVVAHAALLLCGDTGVAHLGTAYGTPSVLLFGPTPPARWGPRIDAAIHHVLWHPDPADPPGDPHGSTVDVRLDRIQVPEVLDHAARLLAT